MISNISLQTLTNIFRICVCFFLIHRTRQKAKHVLIVSYCYLVFKSFVDDMLSFCKVVLFLIFKVSMKTNVQWCGCFSTESRYLDFPQTQALYPIWYYGKVFLPILYDQVGLMVSLSLPTVLWDIDCKSGNVF